MAATGFAAAISEHPIPATAVGEVAGEMLERLGAGADLVCVFVTAPHAGALEDIAAAINTLLSPKVMIGCAASTVIGNGREVEGTPAIAVWGGNVGPVEPIRLDVVDAPTGGRAIGGWPIGLEWVPVEAVLLADPFSFPINTLFDVLNGAGGFPRVSGGMASAGKGPGTNRLVLNGEVYEDGAVGVLIGAVDQILMENVVTQACRPIGDPFVATKVEGNVVYELGGESALTRLTQMLKGDLSEDDINSARDGLLVGRVINEHKDRFESGDFVIRTLMNADPDTGALTIGEKIDVGTILQFQLLDSVMADAELRISLDDRSADAVLVFSDDGRGIRLFEEPDYDAQVIAESLDHAPTAGIHSAGEFGPIHGRNFVHGFSASLLLFERS